MARKIKMMNKKQGENKVLTGVNIEEERIQTIEQLDMLSADDDNRTTKELIGNDIHDGVMYSTKEYRKFKLIKGNRNLNKTKYLQLLKSMEVEQLKIPIAVNEKFEIIDGQHRYHASRELGLPVYYFIVEGYGIEQVKRANLVSSTWTKEDYLGLHISEGLDNYLEFNDLLLECGLNTTDLIKVYAKAQDKSQDQLAYEFENGTLSNEGIEKVEAFLKALKDFEFFKFSKKKQFVAAFIKLFFDNRYDHKRMLKRLEARATVLEETNANVSRDEYLAKLANNIYSFGPGKKNLYYDATNKRFYE